MHLAANAGTRASGAGHGMDHREELVTLITASQRPLFAYIRTLLGSTIEVDDILQEVNLVLWRKGDEFDRSGRFLTWACHIAYLQVLAHVRKRRRERLICFDEEVVTAVAECLANKIDSLDARLEALRACLSKLPAAQRQVILQRYEDGGSAQRVAAGLGRPVGSVKVALHRIRRLLANCIARALGENDGG